jgi:hypothetical protein
LRIVIEELNNIENSREDTNQVLFFIQTPVISPDGTVEVNFKGETGSKIIITITKKDPTAPSTVSGVEVKACTEGK